MSERICGRFVTIDRKPLPIAVPSPLKSILPMRLLTVFSSDGNNFLSAPPICVTMPGSTSMILPSKSGSTSASPVMSVVAASTMPGRMLLMMPGSCGPSVETSVCTACTRRGAIVCKRGTMLSTAVSTLSVRLPTSWSMS